MPVTDPCGPALAQWCHRWPADAQPPLAVAYSAGADSTALLLAAHARWPGRVHALHVHHGLQAAADDFETHARRRCAQLGLPLHVAHRPAHPAPGQSPEDAARQHRYQALASLAQAAGLRTVLLAHHADDQAETVVLALSRGAGLPGLAAMPERFQRHGTVFGRPLLGVAAAALRASLVAAGHGFVDDPSNADLRYTRNRIRARLLPAWDATFPHGRAAIARSARHAAQAQQLLADLARIDLQHTGEPPHISRLQTLSPARQANALRHWLHTHWSAVPSDAQLQALLRQIDACRTRGHHIRLKVANGHIHRQGDHLAYLPAAG